ncbi:unnamed protein product, partial [Tenebrio molitor]
MMNGEHTRTVGLKELETVNDLYYYINDTLIPCMHPTIWYENFVIAPPGLMLDLNSKFMGVARLRQQRVKPKLCQVPKAMELNMSCWPEFSKRYTEKKIFGYRWGQYSPLLQYDRLKNILKYASHENTETLGTVGEFSSYSGGGYVVYLGRTLYNSHANFLKIFKKLWINPDTRVIFIEFLLYNANFNIFNAVKLIVEQSASGYIYKRIEIYAVRMLFVQNELEMTTIGFFILFTVWVGMLLFKQSVGLIRKIHTFYKDLWILTDFVIILLSVMCIGLFALRMQMVGSYLDVLETVKHNQFLSYFYLFYIEDFLTLVAAFLVCIATVRLWKFLRFGVMFRILEKTLAIAAVTLLSATLLFVILLVASASALLLLVGNYFENIYYMVRIVRVMMTMALRPSEMAMTRFIPFKFAMFILILYVVILQITIVVYIMVIVMSYSKAQMEYSSELESYTIKHYVIERIKYLPRYIRYKYFRLKGGQLMVETKVEPKSNKFLYSNSFSLPSPRMRLMRYLLMCLIRNYKRFPNRGYVNDQDTRLMRAVCREFLVKNKNEGEVEVFFKGRMKGKRIKL